MASLRRALTLTLATLLAVPLVSLSTPSPANAASPDVSEPQLVEFEVSPLSIDVSTREQTVAVRARITDDQAGTETPTMTLSSQRTSQSAGFGPMRLIEGDALDGWWSWSATVPRGAAPGNWDVVLYPLRDARGNAGEFGPPARFSSVVNVVNPSGSDTTPPQVVDFEVLPTAVDVSTAAQTVSVRARITDNSSGTTAPTMTLSSTTTDQTTGFGPMQLVEGSSLDGWWEWSATVPVGAAAGNWAVVLYPLRDARGNSGSFGPPPGFPDTVNVVNTAGSDTSPPVLAEFSVSPRTIDVADSSQTVVVRARVVDNMSGAQAPTLTLSSDTTDQSAGFGSMSLVSGNQLDGWYERSVVVPRGAAPGAWSVVLYPLRDARGNSGWFGPPASFDSRVNVVNFSGDVTAPRLTNLTVSPGQYYTGDADLTLTIRATITDDASGAVSPTATIMNGDGSDPDVVVHERLDLVEGTANSGTFEWKGSFPNEGRAGTWTVRIDQLQDVRGNTRNLSTGNTAQFEVISGARPTAPSAPSAVAATPGDRSATVTWTAPASHGGSPITHYVVTASPGNSSATVPATATTGTVARLSNGTAYRFTVSAVNAVGTSPASAQSAAVTPRTVPGAPTSVTATPGNGTAQVSWAAPASNGGAAITGYTIITAPGGQTVNVAATATTGTVTGLTNGTAYRFTVVATNAAGNSVASSQSASVTPRTVPTAPTGVTATSGDRTAQVSWTAPASNGGAAITGYAVTAVPGGHSITVPATATTGTVDGLANGTAYRFTVVATNAAGNSPASTASDPVTPTAPPAPIPPLERLAGDNRYATAAAISEQFEAGVETVYIASGTNFPDALAGAALAGSEDAPVLLTRATSLPEPTVTALERLSPTRIVILGGTPSVSAVVQQQLAQFGQVSRIAGADRYATAALISQRFSASVDTVYVASGRAFPDALAGAALAGANGSPVLLTSPTSLPASVRDALERLDPQRIVVLGGTPSVNAEVFTQLRSIAPATRIAGTDRYETAAMVAAQFDEADRVWVASGTNFPDALAGAALAASNDGPVLLTRQSTLPAATGTAVTALDAQGVVILGDQNSVNDAVARQLAGLVQ